MIRALLSTAAVLALSGCEINIEHGGPVEHATQSVDLDKSEMARVEIRMGAGELQR